MAGSFTSPNLNKVGINFKSLLAILEGLVRFHKLKEGSSSVSKDGLALGVTTETFFELLDGTWEVTLLKEGNTGLFVLLSLGRVNIGLSLLLFIELLNSLHGVLDVGIVVFEESILVSLNRLLQLFLFGLGIGFTGHGLAQFDVVIRLALGQSDGIIADLDAPIVVLLLEEHSSFVCVIGKLLRVQLDSLVVEFESLGEISLFVSIITFKFGVSGFFLLLDSLAFGVGQFSLFSFLTLAFLFFSLLFGFFLGLGDLLW